MPRHIANLIVMLNPVMRDARDAPVGGSGSRTGVIDLADNGVLSADRGSDGSHRVPDGGATAVLVDRFQLSRRLGQHQLRVVSEKYCNRIELLIVDTCGVAMHQIAEGCPVGRTERHVDRESR